MNIKYMIVANNILFIANFELPKRVLTMEQNMRRIKVKALDKCIKKKKERKGKVRWSNLSIISKSKMRAT